MTTGLNQGTATIYQFPAGGRAALGGRRYGETKPALDPAYTNTANCSESWYHQAAIDDERRGWER